MPKFTVEVLIDLEISPPTGPTEVEREWVRSAVDHGLSTLDTRRGLERQLEAALFRDGLPGSAVVRVHVLLATDVDHPADFGDHS